MQFDSVRIDQRRRETRQSNARQLELGCEASPSSMDQKFDHSSSEQRSHDTQPRNKGPVGVGPRHEYQRQRPQPTEVDHPIRMPTG